MQESYLYNFASIHYNKRTSRNNIVGEKHMSPRTKLTVQEQVEHMKSRGISFEIVTEEEAKEYLENNNYFFKLKAYDKMFETYQTGEKKGKYVNLELAYLKEMAILDMHLRHFILKTSVDLEHTIKVRFMQDFNNSESDGYEIVEIYLNAYPDVRDKILKKKEASYCSDLIDKLEKEGYAVWNIIEILSFGDFINLYDLFYETFPEAKSGLLFTYPMRSIKNLRNAAAHNNCILNQLTRAKREDVRENKKVISFVANIKTIGKKQRMNCMSMQVVHDFVTMLYVIDKAVISEGMRENILLSLDNLINGRMIKNGVYFSKNNNLMAVYDFVKKIVDTLLSEE